MTSMRAVLYNSYGPPEVLYDALVPRPVPKAGEVLVKVEAAGVNGGDLLARAGKVRLLTGSRFPQRVGVDFVGRIVTAGGVQNGLPDNELVWGLLPRGRFGSFAEYVAVSPERLSPAPDGLTAAEAASLLAGGTTAITALRTKAGLQPGERLLVRGASGGVGSVAVQLGKALGAHVTALAGAGALDFVRKLGADVVVDYRTTSLNELGRFDVVMDTAGTELVAVRRLLAPGGRMVAIAFDTKRMIPSVLSILASTVHGSRRIRFFSGNPDRGLLAEVTRLVNDGDLRPVVDTVHPFDDIAPAHRALEAGGVHGKHVLQTGP